MKTNHKSTLSATCQLFSRSVFLVAVVLIAFSTEAQNLFVSSYYWNTIFEFTPGGVQSTFYSGLNYGAGLAFNSAGDLFVANFGELIPNNTITKITPDGVESTFASGLDNPNGLAFDSAGNLFVANGNGGTITKITPDGVESTFASGISGVLTGLAIDSVGNLFVADAFNFGYESGTIIKITPDGIQSTFASGLTSPDGLAFGPVPEPSALAMLAAGAGAFLARRCRRNLGKVSPNSSPDEQ